VEVITGLGVRTLADLMSVDGDLERLGVPRIAARRLAAAITALTPEQLGLPVPPPASSSRGGSRRGSIGSAGSSGSLVEFSRRSTSYENLQRLRETELSLCVPPALAPHQNSALRHRD
jgi:hypothetical protein